MPHSSTSVTDSKSSPHGWQSLAKLLGSVTAVQILGFALLPLLGRLYTKADYGILGTLMALVGLTTLLANGRYDLATIVAPLGERIRLLRIVGLSLNLILTSILTILALLAPSWLRETDYERIAPYLLIVPLTTFFSGLFAILASCATAEGRYGRISLGSLLQGYINNGLKVLCGWHGLGVWGFAIAFNTGMAVASLILLWQRIEGSLRSVTWQRCWLVMYHYRRFPLYTIGQGLVVMLIANILPLLLPLHYTPAEIGIVTMLYMITRRPVQVYSETTGRVYARRMVAAREEGKSFLPQIQKLSLRFGGIALVVAAVFPWIATPFVTLVLGEQWADLGEIIIWMLPFLLMEGLCYVFGFVPDVLGKQDRYLLLQCLRLISEVGFILLVSPHLEFGSFIRAYFCFASLEYLVVYSWLYLQVKRSEFAKA